MDPLSTTTISFAGFPASAATTLGRYFSSRSRPFQLGITTLTASVRGAFDAASGRRVRNGCAMTSARKLAASRKGESTSKGSARNRRFRNAMSDDGPQPDLTSELYPARDPHQRELLFQVLLLAIQTLRPNGALFQVSLALLDGGLRARQLLGQARDLGGKACVGIHRPLRLLATLLLQFGDLPVIAGHHVARVLVVTLELF